MDWIKSHLILNARQWWRMWSVRLLALAMAVDGLSLLPLIGFIPGDFIPQSVLNGVQAGLLVCAMVARVFKQKKVTRDDAG